jgi:O-antigen ligase
MMHLVTAMWLISFYFYTKNLKRYQYALLLLVQFILLSLLIWAAGRVHLIIVPLAILMFGILFHSYNATLKIYISSISMILAAVVFLNVIGQDFMFKNLTERMRHDVDNFSALMTIDSNESDKVIGKSESSTDIVSRLGSDRGSLWFKGYDLWQQKPLLGNGADGYYLAKDGGTGTHPHNWIALLLVQYGLLGFVLFCVFIKSVFTLALVSYSNTKNGFNILVIVYNTVFLVYGFLSGCFYYLLPLMFFAIVNGIFLGSYCNARLDRDINEVL